VQGENHGSLNGRDICSGNLQALNYRIQVKGNPLKFAAFPYSHHGCFALNAHGRKPNRPEYKTGIIY
jgi:hypothetical protein